MSAVLARNVGLLLALALVVFLVWKHMQTAPVQTGYTGGAFSQEVDSTAGDSGGNSRFNDQLNLVANNPDH